MRHGGCIRGAETTRESARARAMILHAALIALGALAVAVIVEIFILRVG
jgi:hypothetical protein